MGVAAPFGFGMGPGRPRNDRRAVRSRPPPCYDRDVGDRERKESRPRERVPVGNDVPIAISDRVLVYDAALQTVSAAIVTAVVDARAMTINATLFPKGAAPLPIAEVIVPRNAIFEGVIPARYTWAWPPLRVRIT